MGTVSGYDMLMKPIENGSLKDFRNQLIMHAYGNVLEIGIGTGANIPFYKQNDKIESITALDIKVNKKLLATEVGITLIEGSCEAMPFPDQCFDTVVVTLLLCSVSDVDKSLDEIKRVLKDDGKFIYIEHILPEGNVGKKVFNTLTPVWKKVAHNCHLNRKTDEVIENNGFDCLISGKMMKTYGCYGVCEKK